MIWYIFITTYLILRTAALPTDYCLRNVFQVAVGTIANQKQIFLTVTYTSPQLCISKCALNPFCQQVQYKFATGECGMTYVQLNCGAGGTTLAMLGRLELLSYNLTASSVMTAGCFACQDGTPPPSVAWSKITLPNPDPGSNILSASDIATINQQFATPQCQIAKMANIDFSLEQYKGRWWGLLSGGPFQQAFRGLMMDNFQAADTQNLILRQVSQRTDYGCTANYYTWQPLKLGGQNLWQKTVNYTENYNALLYGQNGRINSFYYRILWANNNAMVQYVCTSPFVNGTCAGFQSALYVFARSQQAMKATNLDAFNIFLNYTCTPGSFVKLDTTVPCVQAYVNNTNLYTVAQNCDYGNESWITQHAVSVSYDNITTQGDSITIAGSPYGSFITTTQGSQDKLQVTNYQQNKITLSAPGGTCQIVQSTLSQQTSPNLWLQTASLQDAPNLITNSYFWQVAADGLLQANVGCIGSKACNDTSAMYAVGHRRYRKLSKLFFETRLFPIIAASCVDPLQIGFAQAVRPPQLTCPVNASAPTCLNSDLPKLVSPSFDLKKIVGKWALIQVQSVINWESMGCTFTQPSSGTSVNGQCYIRSFFNCDGPYNLTITMKAPGILTWSFQYPVFGTYTETLYVLYQTDNVLAVYGCSFNGEDTDGTCRDDRLIGLVFATPNYAYSNYFSSTGVLISNRSV